MIATRGSCPYTGHVRLEKYRGLARTIDHFGENGIDKLDYAIVIVGRAGRTS